MLRRPTIQTFQTLKLSMFCNQPHKRGYEIITTTWGYEIMAYKWGEEILSYRWENEIKAHKRRNEILCNTRCPLTRGS